MIAIINSGGANITSVMLALERLGAKAKLTADIDEIKAASHVILPGVGAAANAMKNLHDLQLLKIIPHLTQPVLGICLGMQLLYESSEEGGVNCLNIIKGKISRLPLLHDLTIPHMGWNTIKISKADLLFENIKDESYVYFVHSYAAPVTQATTAVTTYGASFAAAVQHDNFFGMQFHPERSGEVGELMLKNFLQL